jgi:putative membrane protein
MRKSILAAGLLAFLCAGALPARAQTHPAQLGVAVGEPGKQTGSNFVKTMMMADKYAIAAGKLALKDARDPAVREVAQDMIAVHRKKANQLKKVYDRTLAARSPTPPPVFDPPHQRLYHALQVSGAAFDRVYIAQQLDDHQAALAFAQGYADHGKSPKLRSYAQKRVPEIRDHLARLQNLSGQTLAQNGPPAR